jgi:TetR/AcrR family transcriptional regulator, transcriptional repressor for nem operon
MPMTAKGQRTREAMVEAAARLMHDRGIAATTVEDVLAASGTGKSQMYHYFGGKRELVAAVLDHQFGLVMQAQGTLRDTASADPGRWRDEVLAAHRRSRFGNCPLGVFAGQVENDVLLRKALAALFDRWRGAIGALLERARDARHLPADADPVSGSVVLLAALQGGTLLSHLARDPEPLASALDQALRGLGYVRP